MVLPSTGAISFSTIQTEFGGTEPISLSEYYNGGSYVVGVTAVPSSGAFSVSQMYGKQKGDLYAFSSHTFTNAGATGQNGPSLTAVRNAYSSTAWASTYLNMDVTGVQKWTVPATKTYAISLAGARGGMATWNSNVVSGRKVSGNMSLTKGDVLYIVVGQRGGDIDYQGGGGGGTFVFLNTVSFAAVLFAAGGGGGSTHTRLGTVGTTLSSGGTGGLGISQIPGGNGGGGGGAGFGGTGFNTSGWTGTSGGNGNNTTVVGGNGGTGNAGGGGGGGGGVFNSTTSSTFIGGTGTGTGNAAGGNGGFGGGGGGGIGGAGGGGAGGGGGYSGGGGGGASQSDAGGGGGGGSFVTASATLRSINDGTNNGDGYVTITAL